MIELANRIIGALRATVGLAADDCIVAVDDPRNASIHRYVRPFQPARIARSIVAFVMAADHVDDILAECGGLLNDVHAVVDVRADDVVFLFGQRAFLHADHSWDT